ncbi:hypothetical protein EDC04DRAFT_2834080 [Pisolithus marmoratus]|nr:hypothetical protein EDC04DRAFT_2834080 [Pisolithus marmoratus]
MHRCSAGPIAFTDMLTLCCAVISGPSPGPYQVIRPCAGPYSIYCQSMCFIPDCRLTRCGIWNVRASHPHICPTVHCV